MNGRFTKKIALMLFTFIFIISIFGVAHAQETTVIDAQDIYAGIGAVLAPQGGMINPDIIQARLIIFILLCVVLVPLMNKVPGIGSSGGGW